MDDKIITYEDPSSTSSRYSDHELNEDIMKTNKSLLLRQPTIKKGRRSTLGAIICRSFQNLLPINNNTSPTKHRKSDTSLLSSSPNESSYRIEGHVKQLSRIATFEQPKSDEFCNVNDDDSPNTYHRSERSKSFDASSSLISREGGGAYGSNTTAGTSSFGNLLSLPPPLTYYSVSSGATTRSNSREADRRSSSSNLTTPRAAFTEITNNTLQTGIFMENPGEEEIRLSIGNNNSRNRHSVRLRKKFGEILNRGRNRLLVNPTNPSDNNNNNNNNLSIDKLDLRVVKYTSHGGSHLGPINKINKKKENSRSKLLSAPIIDLEEVSRSYNDIYRYLEDSATKGLSLKHNMAASSEYARSAEKFINYDYNEYRKSDGNIHLQKTTPSSLLPQSIGNHVSSSSTSSIQGLLGHENDENTKNKQDTTATTKLNQAETQLFEFEPAVDTRAIYYSKKFNKLKTAAIAAALLKPTNPPQSALSPYQINTSNYDGTGCQLVDRFKISKNPPSLSRTKNSKSAAHLFIINDKEDERAALNLDGSCSGTTGSSSLSPPSDFFQQPQQQPALISRPNIAPAKNSILSAPLLDVCLHCLYHDRARYMHVQRLISASYFHENIPPIKPTNVANEVSTNASPSTNIYNPEVTSTTNTPSKSPSSITLPLISISNPNDEIIDEETTTKPRSLDEESEPSSSSLIHFAFPGAAIAGKESNGTISDPTKISNCKTLTETSRRKFEFLRDVLNNMHIVGKGGHKETDTTKTGGNVVGSDLLRRVYSRRSLPIYPYASILALGALDLSLFGKKEIRSKSLDYSQLNIPNFPILYKKSISGISGTTPSSAKDHHNTTLTMNKSPTSPGIHHKSDHNLNESQVRDQLFQTDTATVDEQTKILSTIRTAKRRGAVELDSRYKTTIDWTAKASPTEHIWTEYTNASEICYLIENSNCQKTGNRKRCSSCKICVHEDCISLLARIGFHCKPTFYPENVEIPPNSLKNIPLLSEKSGKVSQNGIKNLLDRQTLEAQLGLEKCHDYMLKHHWVHRRRQDGKCKSCGKSFSTKFNFYSKEIVAISCSWCKEAYHNKVSCFTLKLFEEACYMGSLSNLTIPPWWILKAEFRNGSNNGAKVSANEKNSSVVLRKKTTYRKGGGGIAAPLTIKKPIHKKIGPTSNRKNSRKCEDLSRHGSIVHDTLPNFKDDYDPIGVLSHGKAQNTQSKLSALTSAPNSNTTISPLSRKTTTKISVTSSKKSRRNSSVQKRRAAAAVLPVFYIQPCQSYFFRCSSKNAAAWPRDATLPANVAQMAEDYMKCGDTPVLVLINPKSGGNKGAKLIYKFHWLLNPRQIFDITKMKPQFILELFGKVPSLRILVCGGDGTAGWIFSALDELAEKNLISDIPAVAILPLGTGNDLSRYLGWGGSYTDDSLHKILMNVVQNPIRKLDRWDIKVKPFIMPYRSNSFDIDSDYSSTAAPSNQQKYLERSRTNPALIVQVQHGVEGGNLTSSHDKGVLFNYGSSSNLTSLNLTAQSKSTHPRGIDNFTPTKATTTPFALTSESPTAGFKIGDSNKSINALITNTFVFPGTPGLENNELDNNPSSQTATTAKSVSPNQILQISPPVKSNLPLNVFNNYFGLGSDAQVTLEFHLSREANPEKFSSRFRNKMFYAGVGGKDILKRSWKDLLNHVNLKCDGVDLTGKIRDMKFHCLLFLNISRYAGGTLPWGTDTYSNPSCSGPNTSTCVGGGSVSPESSSSISFLNHTKDRGDFSSILSKPYTSDKLPPSPTLGTITAFQTQTIIPDLNSTSTIGGYIESEFNSTTVPSGYTSNFYSGGTSTSASFEKPRCDDGLIEIIGFTAASLAALQVGGHGYRICQCRTVRLITTAEIPCQVDGEPCKLAPSIIEISLRNKANVIINKRKYNTEHEEPLLSLTGGGGGCPYDSVYMDQIKPYVFDEENFVGDLEEAKIEQFIREHNIQRYTPKSIAPLIAAPIGLETEISAVPGTLRPTTATFKQFEINETETNLVVPEIACPVTTKKIDISTKIITPKTSPEQDDSFSNETRDLFDCPSLRISDDSPIIKSGSSLQGSENNSQNISKNVSKDNIVGEGFTCNNNSNSQGFRRKSRAVQDFLETTQKLATLQVQQELAQKERLINLAANIIPVNLDNRTAPLTKTKLPSSALFLCEDEEDTSTSTPATISTTPSSEDDIINLDEDDLFKPISSTKKVQNRISQPVLHDSNLPSRSTKEFAVQNPLTIISPSPKSTKPMTSTTKNIVIIANMRHETGHNLKTCIYPNPTTVFNNASWYQNNDTVFKRRAIQSPLTPESDFIEAAKRGDLYKMKSLMTKETIDLRQMDSTGMNALHHASKSGFKNVVKFILEHDPGMIDSKDKIKHQTSLHKAAWYSRRGVCSILVENGAALDSLDYQGRTPHDLAYLAGDVQLSTYLKPFYKAPLPNSIPSTSPNNNNNHVNNILETLV